MPRGNSKALDLRQRMAAAALFQDVSLSRQPVNEPLKLDAIMSRLDEDDFRVNGSTDFENLRSLVMLLDIVIDNASFLHPKEPQPAQAPLPQKENHVVSSSTTTTTTTEADFDTAIDRLTFRLKLIHDKIHDSNQLARKVTKSSIDLVAKRLTYAVRTRPPPKTSIFDLDPSSSAAAKQEDENAPRQRAFMKNWSLKRTMENKEKEKGKDVEDVEVGGGGGSAGRSANGNGNGDANGDKEKKKKNGNEGVGGSNGGK